MNQNDLALRYQGPFHIQNTNKMGGGKIANLLNLFHIRFWAPIHTINPSKRGGKPKRIPDCNLHVHGVEVLPWDRNLDPGRARAPPRPMALSRKSGASKMGGGSLKKNGTLNFKLLPKKWRLGKLCRATDWAKTSGDSHYTL